MKTYFVSGRVEGCFPDDDGATVSQHGATPTAGDRALASVLIVEAETLEQAVSLAQGHPGLAFGTEIEVRPVKALAPG